jgi:hypothetical protein
MGRCTAIGWRWLRRCPYLVHPLSIEKGRCHRTRWRCPRWCTVMPVAVHTTTSGASLSTSSPRPCSGGHHPRGGGSTRQGVAVPHQNTSLLAFLVGHCHRGGGAPDRAWRCPRGSNPSPATPPFLHLFHHLCKYANTPSVSPSCVSVLAFSQSFFKG